MSEPLTAEEEAPRRWTGEGRTTTITEAALRGLVSQIPGLRMEWSDVARDPTFIREDAARPAEGLDVERLDAALDGFDIAYPYVTLSEITAAGSISNAKRARFLAAYSAARLGADRTEEPRE